MAEWRTGYVLAWTESDGPGRPPAGPRRTLSYALAGAMGVVFSGILFTDTLCPEHRTWVQLLASVAFVGTVVAIVGLVREWASAAAWTLCSAVAGVAIGVLDAAHAPGRGRLVAAGFAVVAVGAAVLALSQLRVARWERRVLRDSGPVTRRTDAVADAETASPTTPATHAVPATPATATDNQPVAS